MKQANVTVAPDLRQETQELIGMLADAVSELGRRADRGDEVALDLLKSVRDEVYQLHHTAKNGDADTVLVTNLGRAK